MENWSYYFNYANGKLYWGIKPSNSISEGDEAKNINADGHIRVTIKGKSYYAHRIIWEMHNGKIPEGMVIDHINENKQDNRIENLQCITPKENLQRSITSKKVEYRPKMSKVRPYTIRRVFNGVAKHLGMFGTPCGAMMAYNTFFIR